MTRILFISHDSGRTGAPIGLLAFMRWLRANTRFELGSILRSAGPLEPSFKELGPSLTLAQSRFAGSRLGKRLRRLVPAARGYDESPKIRKMFGKGGYDLIYANTLTNGRTVDCLRSLGIPVVTHVHELAYWVSRSGQDNIKRVLAQTTSYVAASGAVMNYLIRQHKVPTKDVSVVYEHIRELPSVPTAAQRAAAREALGIPAGTIVIGGCGAEHWRKGRDLIPQLLSSLRRISPHKTFSFIWIGRPGSTDEEYALRYDLRQAGVQDGYRTTGEVEDPFRFYAALDVFALLSREDPYPLACLEVAATQVPVVCFADAGGIPEFVQDGCGFAVPYLDVEAMAGEIVRLVENPSLAHECGLRGRAKVSRENMVETTAPLLVGVIEQTLAIYPSA